MVMELLSFYVETSSTEANNADTTALCSLWSYLYVKVKITLLV